RIPSPAGRNPAPGARPGSRVRRRARPRAWSSPRARARADRSRPPWVVLQPRVAPPERALAHCFLPPDLSAICATLAALRDASDGDRKHEALARGVGREELRHVIVEEGEAAGAETERVGREVGLAAADRRLELGDAIAAAAESIQERTEIRQPVEIDRRIGGD